MAGQSGKTVGLVQDDQPSRHLLWEIFSVAGHDDDRQIGTPPLDRSNQSPAAHDGHPHISQQKGGGVLLVDLQRLNPVMSERDPEAFGF